MESFICKFCDCAFGKGVRANGEPCAICNPPAETPFEEKVANFIARLGEINKSLVKAINTYGNDSALAKSIKKDLVETSTVFAEMCTRENKSCSSGCAF